MEAVRGLCTGWLALTLILTLTLALILSLTLTLILSLTRRVGAVHVARVASAAECSWAVAEAERHAGWYAA